MEKGMSVFVSSTYEDLRAYREAVAEAITGLGFVANDMRRWSADGRAPTRRSVDGVAESDVMILLVAHRYGHVPPGEQHSIVELEYLAARSSAIPVLAFFLDPEVPWPPHYIDWDSRTELARFRTMVEQEVTRRTFTTTEGLARQVTQALATLSGRQQEERQQEEQTLPSARPAATPAELRTQADVLVELGTAEDGLPLLLDVRRSRDLDVLDSRVENLRTALRKLDLTPEVIEFDAFRRSITRTLQENWATTGFNDVMMLDGEVRRLFVTSSSIVATFESCLAGLLRSNGPMGETPGSRGRGTVQPPGALKVEAASVGASDGASATPLVLQSSKAEYQPYFAEPYARPPLQSAGGSNRYLAVDPERGTTHCVGRSEQRLVEWRRFIFEYPLPALPSAQLVFDHQGETLRCPLPEASTRLAEVVRRAGHADGLGSSRVIAERAEVLALIRAVADALEDHHARGVVHGDVKPHNILLHAGGPVLIDEFAVPPGRPAPGWTPGWSPPEQMMGLPVAPTSDVYSLGMMVKNALGASLVGEVRKYRGLPSSNGPVEFDLLHNPVAVLSESEAAAHFDARATNAWKGLIESALYFDPQQRPPSAAAFSAELGQILADYPPAGELGFVPTGQFGPARLLGGRDRVSRIIEVASDGLAYPH